MSQQILKEFERQPSKAAFFILIIFFLNCSPDIHSLFKYLLASLNILQQKDLSYLVLIILIYMKPQRNNRQNSKAADPKWAFPRLVQRKLSGRCGRSFFCLKGWVGGNTIYTHNDFRHPAASVQATFLKYLSVTYDLLAPHPSLDNTNALSHSQYATEARAMRWHR